MQEVSITTEGIQKNLKNFKPLDALCEYIWNGFDAQADTVCINLHTNELGLINMIYRLFLIFLLFRTGRYHCF